MAIFGGRGDVRRAAFFPGGAAATSGSRLAQNADTRPARGFWVEQGESPEAVRTYGRTMVAVDSVFGQYDVHTCR